MSDIRNLIFAPGTQGPPGPGTEIIDPDVTLSSDSDTLAPSVHAVRAYIANILGGSDVDLSLVVYNTRRINTTGSLTGGGDLASNRNLSLVGDSSTPGNTKYYGTDGTGSKGFYDIPTSKHITLAITIPYKPNSGDQLLYFPQTESVSWPVNAPDSIGKLVSQALISVPILINIKKNGSIVGTITCAINSYDFVFNVSSAISLVTGDILELTMSDTGGVIDSSIKGFGLTIRLDRP